jgi:hypothetical protein
VDHRRNQRENKKVPEFNENENTIYHNLWDSAKAVLREMFIAKSAYIMGMERSEIKDLMLHLKIPEKE